MGVNERVSALLGNLLKNRESDLYERHIGGKRTKMHTFWCIHCACRVKAVGEECVEVLKNCEKKKVGLASRALVTSPL